MSKLFSVPRNIYFACNLLYSILLLDDQVFCNSNESVVEQKAIKPIEYYSLF